MELSIEQIATAFSNGKFEIAYPFLSNNIRWDIVGEKLILGKAAVIKFCEQTATYFASVTTKFTMNKLIAGDHCIAINGSAEFLNKAGKTSRVSSCDVYRFNDGMLIEITSYCIKINT